MALWAIDNQNIDGSWSNFYFAFPDSPFSCMAQGEGCSLLLRAYELEKDERFTRCAQKAIDFMLKDISEGGTAVSQENGITLYEYTNQHLVLNGWIFGIFGLFDYVLFSKDDFYNQKLNSTLSAIACCLKDFDTGYWSFYNIDGSIISSRFYHKLHISLLKTLGTLFNDCLFAEYSKKMARL